VEVHEPQESLPGQQKLDSRFCVEVPRASVGVGWQLDSTTTDGWMGTVASGTKSAAKNVASGTTSVVKKVASGTTSVVGTVAAKTKSMVLGRGGNQGEKNMIKLCVLPITSSCDRCEKFEGDLGEVKFWHEIDKSKSIKEQIKGVLSLEAKWLDMHVVGPGSDRFLGLAEYKRFDFGKLYDAYKDWGVSTDLPEKEFDVACKNLIAKAGKPGSDIWLRVEIEDEKLLGEFFDRESSAAKKQRILQLKSRDAPEIDYLSRF
jgi:hypothetical protein